MKDGPTAIDVSSLSELFRIRNDEDVLRTRLQKMEASRERISEVVFRRVREDYEKKKAALEAEARAPRSQAALEYRRLRELTVEAEKALQEAKFELEEIEFRHELGEYPSEDFGARKAECAARVADRKKVLDEFAAMKTEFVKAFPSEEELERAAGSPVAAPKPPVDLGATTTSPRMARPRLPEPFPPDANPDATLIGAPPPLLRPPQTPAAAPPGPRPARLILLEDDRPEREFPLKRAPMSIGRASENEIYVPFPDVSRVHATIVPEGTTQFKLIDRGSPNGVIVNGNLIQEHLLVDGDTIQMGRRKFVFRD